MNLSLEEASTLADLIDRLDLTLSEAEAGVYSRLCLFLHRHRRTRARESGRSETEMEKAYRLDVEEDERGDFR